MELGVVQLEAALSKATLEDEKDEISLLLGVCYTFFLEQPQKAIPILERVLAHNPDIKINFPEQKIWDISPRNTLGFSYLKNGEWQRSVDMFETYLQKYPHAPLVMWGASQARSKLGKAGHPPATPMVVAKNTYLASDKLTAAGSLLVNAAELAQALGLQYAVQEGQAAVLSRADRQIVVTADGKLLAGNNTAIAAPAALAKDQQLLIPLRAVGEYFGCQVRWDPLAKVAWLN